jgi:hypothetical protein
MTMDTDRQRRSRPYATKRDPGEPGNTLPILFGILGVALLAFLGGSYAMNRGLFPADYLRRAFDSGNALYDKMTRYQDPVQTDFWQPARTEGRGVVFHDPGAAYEGLTLYTSTHDQRAFLIDMEGRVVHQWALPFSKVWDDTAAVKNPQPDSMVWIEKAHLFPNGDLLALYAANGDTPWGYGLVKMDRNSKVIWRYLEHAHHDFDIDRDGNIYVLTQAIAENDLPGFEHLNKPRIDDFVAKLSPDGHELERFWVTGAFAESGFGRRLYFVPWDVHQSRGDYLHANAVDVLDAPVPGIPESRAGQVLLSLREVSTVALADMEKQSMVWGATGAWLRQHDAQFLPDGSLMLFDNEGAPGGHGPSRVIELDPATEQITWSYGNRADQPLDSVARSSETRLANGNTLIVESMAGRMIEVTPAGRIVWDFVNPVRGGAAEDRIPVIFWAERFAPDRDLTPDFRTALGLGGETPPADSPAR